MPIMNPRVLAFEYKGNHKLKLRFTNDEVKLFDLSPYLEYQIYQPLKNEALCKTVKTFNGTIRWNDEIDFDPDTLYLESKEWI